MSENKQPRCGDERRPAKQFNAEQVTEYLNMEAAYREMTAKFEELTANENMTNGEYADLCRRYAYATIQMVKLRSFIRGPKV